MFAVRSVPRLSASLSSPAASLAVAPAQRTFWKQLLGIVPEQTAEEKKQSELERVPLMQGPGAKLGTVSAHTIAKQTGQTECLGLGEVKVMRNERAS